MGSSLYELQKMNARVLLEFLECFWFLTVPFSLCFSLYSIRYVLSQIDNCIQYGEDADVKVKDFDPEDD